MVVASHDKHTSLLYFSNVIFACSFVTAKHFYLSLIFANKAGVYFNDSTLNVGSYPRNYYGCGKALQTHKLIIFTSVL
jgi:hypothetical protein